EDDAEIDSDWIDAVEEASSEDVVPVIKSEPHKEKCYRKDCHCGLGHVETTLSPETRKMMDKVLAEEKEVQEETEEVEEAAPTQDDGLTFEELLLAVSIKSTKSDTILTMDDYLSAEPAPIPWQAMYGKMKEWAQQTELSMSVAYPAILAAYSAIPKYDDILGVRFNL